MCDELAAVKAAVTRYAASFDAAVITPREAAEVVDLVTAIEASASAIRSLAAVRLAEGKEWRESGHRSAADELALRTGTTVCAAREVLETGRQLASNPELGTAARAGKLSPQKTALLAGAAEAAPDALAGLLELARSAPVGTLREAVAKARAAATPDPEARRRAVHARRHLRTWTDVEGVWHLRASGCPEDGAQVMAVLSPRADARFDEARRAGEREDPAAYRFDALVSLCREFAAAGTGEPRTAEDTDGTAEPGDATSPPAPGRRSRRRTGAPVKLLLRVDYDTWLRGVVAEGETCELVGYGPVPVSVVRDLMETGDPFVAAVLTKAKKVAGVAHLGRAPNAWQKTALEWLYPSCAAEDCHVQAHLQADHRDDWARTHFTAFDLLDLLCAHHHGLKTRENWSLVEGRGKRPFVPPWDPRHPKHKDQGGCGAPAARTG